MSITDVLSRIGQIEQQISSMENGSMIAGGTVSTAEAGDGTTGTASTSGSSFSQALTQAQASNPSSAAASASVDADTPLTTGLVGPDGPTLTPSTSTDDAALTSGTVAGTDGTSAFPTLAGSALSTVPADTTALGTSEPSGGAAPTDAALATPYASTPATSAGVALPANTGTMLTSDQQQFASTLSADTGLNPGVISSWLLAEESGGAAQSRQAAGNNDWLNIGYTGSGEMGTSDAIWSDPTTAANATAAWLNGQDSIAGYGTASSGIQAILGTVGQTPQAQIEALQSSGWSGSGYPSLPAIYASVTGS